MSNTKNRIAALATGILLAVGAFAFEPQAETAPQTAAPQTDVASMIAVGGVNQLDTYLSQEKYRGTEFRFISEVTRTSRKHPLTYMLMHDGAIATTHNRALNANELSGHYDFAYALMRRWTLADGRLQLNAGGMVNAFLGFCYNTRNSSSNNPAQAYASLDLGPQIMARYTFSLWHKTFHLSYTARVPFVGMGFSPNYGQSYYEIFQRGNSDHNVVFRSIATPQLRQQLALDVPVSSRVAIRIGYLGDYRQATPNNLKQHSYTHAGEIGVVLSR